jgi:hypothetical protein
MPEPVRIVRSFAQRASSLSSSDGSGLYGSLRRRTDGLTRSPADASEFTIPHRDLKRLADGYGVPLVRPYSARPDEYRKDVRDGFSRFKEEEKR